VVLTALVGVVAFTTLFDVFTDLSLGVQSFPALGSYGPSGRSVVTAISVVVILTEACRTRPRMWVIVCGLLLLISPVVGIQRASLVQAVLCVGGLAIVVFGRTWRRRAQLTPTVSGLVVLGIVGVAVAVLVIPPAITGEQSILIRSLEHAFTGEGQVASADARKLLWSESRDLIEEHPVAGWGLGKRAALARPFPLQPLEMSSHNVILDLWIRAGLVGVLLFVAGILLSLRDATRTWRRHPDPVVGAFAVGCGIGLIGLLGKGFVEPMFDNFRLAMLLGMLLGGIVAATSSADEPETVAAPDERRAAVTVG
jgi:O-antigen ligase